MPVPAESYLQLNYRALARIGARDQDGLLAIPQDGGVEALIESARAVLAAEAKTIQAMKEEGRALRSIVHRRVGGALQQLR